jgi:autotransporter-associated beta strand protein
VSAGFVVLPACPIWASTTFAWAINGGAFGASSGSWNTSTNWSPAGPANGSDNTADFSQSFFENPSTVTLDGSFTIGNLHFGDTKGAGHAWSVETGSGGQLTLSTTSGTPTINVDNQQVATINAVLAGTGFTKIGAGTLTLGGGSANTFTGDTTVAIGTLVLNKPSGPALGGNLILTGSGSSGTVVSDVIQSNNNQLVPTAVVTINPTIGSYGAWELRGFSQTVAGIADNGQGQIEISDAGTQSSGNSTLTLNGSGTYTYAGRLREHNDLTLGGSLNLVKNGTGTQILGGQHIQYAGSTTVNQGRLILSNAVNFGSVTTNNTTIELMASGSFSFQGNPPTFCGTGTVVKTGPDTIYFGYIFQPGDGGVNFSMATNGWIDIQAGTLQNFGGSGNWTNNKASLHIASGALLQMSGNSVWVDALTGSGTVDQAGTPQPQRLTIGVAGGSGVFSGLLENTGSPITLIKAGTGTQTLSGANTYGGGTIISNGTFLVDNNSGSGTGTGSVTVVNGATLGGKGIIAGPVSLGAGAVLSPGDPVGTLTVNNSLALNNSSVLRFALGTSSARASVSGALTLGGTLNVIDAGGFNTGTYTLFAYGGALTYNGLTVGTKPNPSFTYVVSTGTVGQVNLIVTGPSSPPVAAFSGSPTNGTAPLAVTFTDNSTGTISNWFWNFGDGNTTNFAASTNPLHTYNAGTYTVTLIVSGSAGSSTNIQSNYIVAVNPPAPAAAFSASQTNGTAPLAVTFTDSSTGSISNRFWNFGDGNTTNFVVSTNPLHTYNVGTYTVSLTVSGLGGTNTSTRSNYIVALNPAHLVVNPGSLNFGSVTIGQTNNLNFSVINTGDVSLSGTATSAAPFAIANGGSYTVGGGTTQTVTVAFAPGSAAAFTGSVIFASTGGNSTNVVSGVGLTPGNISVTPATLDFGALMTGTTAQASFVVTNSGGTAVTNGTATVNGGPFTIVAGATFSMSGFGTTNVTLRFAPVSAGAFTNKVVFTTANGGNASNIVTGTGAIVPVASFTGSPTNGTEPLLVTFTDTTTGTITNSFWDFGDSSSTNVTTNTVAHTYSAGTYTVMLVDSGPAGVSTNIQASYIKVLTTFQAWQQQYFGCTGCPQAAPDADPFGKGMSNTNQFLAGLDPTNSASLFRISSVTSSPNDIIVTWQTAGGKTNVVQRTNGQLDGSYTNDFQDIASVVITGVGDTSTNYVDTGGATNSPSSYYRVRLGP